MNQLKTFAAGANDEAAVEVLAERSEVSADYQWKTDDIFEDDEAWEAALAWIQEQVHQLKTFKGHLAGSASQLVACLQLRDEISAVFGRVFLYAGLNNDQDTREPRYQAFREKAASVMVQVNGATAFIQPEILAIDEQKLQSFIEEDKQLQAYRHQLNNLLRSRAHVLTPDQESLLAMSGEMSQTPYNAFSMFNNADIKFPAVKDEKGKEIELTKGRYSRLMESPDRQVRSDAFQAFYGTYAGWTNTLAAILSGAVKRDIFYARTRRYDNSLAAALHADNIPVPVYSNVVDTINERLAPLHRYMGLRKRLLKLETVEAWDLSVPVLSEVDFETPYDNTRKILSDAFVPLGEQYVSDLKQSFRNGWIDVYENKGKRSGAYSWASHGVHPFILLNYNKTLNDMFTLAHELGHAMHSFYTHANQPYQYSRYTIFVAEVASTLNEALLMDYLLRNTPDRDRKLYLLNKYIDQIRGTVYIQSLFAEFEKIIHERVESGAALTADSLNALNRELYTRYFGAEFNMHALFDINWCRIPHYYYNFYVYKYATGFSAATALSRNILSGDTDARDAYLKFLGRGCSAYSIDLLKDAGVDMTSPDPIRATTELMDTLLDQMEELLSEDSID